MFRVTQAFKRQFTTARYISSLDIM